VGGENKMSRTRGRLDSDLPYVDGHAAFGISDMSTTTSTALAPAYSATLGLGGTVAASTATVVQIPLENLIYRTGLRDDLQEQYGGGITAGVPAAANGTAVTPTNPFTTPAGVTGRPPYPGVTSFVPVASRPKGISINSLTLVYSITTNAATLNQVQVLSFTYANAAAPIVTTLLANGANGLATAASTAGQTYATTAALTNQNFIVGVNQIPVVQWSITPGAGGATLYQVIANVTYNFN
jgi:hypothetical protein